MKSIGRRGLGALLGAALIACGGGSDERAGQGAEPAASADQAAVTRSAETIGAEDPDTTIPEVLEVSLRPSPPEPGEVIRAVVDVDAQGGYALSYVWSLAGQSIEDDRGAIELPKLRKGQTVSVSVVAANAAGESEPVVAETTVENTEPTIMNLEIEEKLGSGGEVEAWQANAWARDPDNDEVELEYTWLLNGRATGVETSSYPLEGLKRGDRVSVRVVASDGEDESDAAESGILEIGNTAPEITSRPPRLDDSGHFTYQVEASDGDGDRMLSYKLVDSPRGMQIHPYKGTITWQPGADQAGKHRVEIAVEDRNGGRSTQSFMIPVAERYGDAPPASIP